MEKILEKYYKVYDTECFTRGLLAAQVICTRKMLECNTNGEVELLSKVMQDIITLMEIANKSTEE